MEQSLLTSNFEYVCDKSATESITINKADGSTMQMKLPEAYDLYQFLREVFYPHEETFLAPRVKA